MDCEKSPPPPSPPPLDASPAHSPDPMAAVVASHPFDSPHDPRVAAAQASGVVKPRYRPAPAKTFQCRGYGECRMKAHRRASLHLPLLQAVLPPRQPPPARPDRPRDKQEQNERMMQELTSLHANMTAAAKGGPARNKRPQLSSGSPGSLTGAVPAMAVKQEEGAHGLPIAQRPGTSTGYEGANALFHHPGSSPWLMQSADVDRAPAAARPPNSHSFRDPGQSFRASINAAPSPPSTAGYQHQLGHHSGQSFLVPSATQFNFSLPDLPSAPRPGSSSGPPADPARSLPPLSAVVASSLPPPPAAAPSPTAARPRITAPAATHTLILLPLPTPSGPYHGRRPSTATRPGTAPASYYYPPGSAGSGAYAAGVPGLGPRGSELSLRFAVGHPGRLGGGLEPIRRLAAAMEAASRMREETSRPSYAPTHMGHRPGSTLANDLSLDPTTTMAHGNAQNGSAEMLAAQLAAGPGPSTTTGPTLGPNLDGSLSWNSATTHLQMQQQLEHLYRSQTQQQHQQLAQARQHAASRGPQHHPDSSLPPHNSHSSTAPPAAPLRPQSVHPPSQVAHHHYSLELHRQQQEQLRQRLQDQQRSETEREQRRRNSEEAYMMQQLAAAESYGVPLSDSPHMAQAGSTYFPGPGTDGPRGRHPSHPRPSHLHGHMPGLPSAMHPLQAHLAHPQIMADAGAYPPHHLVMDGVGPDPLELAVLRDSPVGMVKYGSPLPLE
ncbi:uncharacterized protein BXZ73DRAFT_79022 [Epithele typhae]|uniref:uncharacterized protein n=1 Tax=Epithele typhae TaxID=378194 RepID=UPI002008322E|nr:uncharacterized protein BXZ73DRAFT_79022 [Epithele typhae]KAH9925353.1 hypothetical protein BXZ73DRAFT_79022 [Epithele typhae]